MLHKLEDVSGHWDQLSFGVPGCRMDCHLHLDVDCLSMILAWACHSIGVVETGLLKWLYWIAAMRRTLCFDLLLRRS